MQIGALLLTCRGELNPKDGDLTFVGMVMGSLPLDIHISKLILLGHVFDVLAETIIMGELFGLSSNRGCGVQILMLAMANVNKVWFVWKYVLQHFKLSEKYVWFQDVPCL